MRVAPPTWIRQLGTKIGNQTISNPLMSWLRETIFIIHGPRENPLITVSGLARCASDLGLTVACAYQHVLLNHEQRAAGIRGPLNVRLRIRIFGQHVAQLKPGIPHCNNLANHLIGSHNQRRSSTTSAMGAGKMASPRLPHLPTTLIQSPMLTMA